jgi:hypothetical protein
MHQTWTSVENYQMWYYFVYIVYVACILLVQLFDELVITTYIYWPIECPPRASFVGVFEFARIDVCLLTIKVHSKSSFNMWVFEFARISRTFIGYLNTTQKPFFWYMNPKWTKNNTLELPKKFNTQRPIVDVMEENITHMIQTMQFTYGHLVSINSIKLLYYNFLQKKLYLSKHTLKIL